MGKGRTNDSGLTSTGSVLWRMERQYSGPTRPGSPFPLSPQSSVLITLLVGALVALAGCTATTSENPVAQHQDQALKDPMNYTPDSPNTDIMGGGLGNYDNKAMKRDLDDFFFNP